MKTNLKKYKLMLLLSSLVVLLPILIGLFLWKALPEQMPIHWGFGGEADGFASRAFAVFVFPLILLAFHWLVIFFISLDKRNAVQSQKAILLSLWITPVLSLLIGGLSYSAALGQNFQADRIIMLFLAFLLGVCGNLMPKFTPNNTLGLRVKWTLESDENWYASHRFCGKVWVICSILIIASCFFPREIFYPLALGLFLFMVIVPIVFSYRYSKKEKENQE